VQVRKGFSLVEVLVAAVIAIIALLGLLATAAYFERYSVRRALLRQASGILSNRLEIVKSMPYQNVTEVKLNNGANNCLEALNNCTSSNSPNCVERIVENKTRKFGLYYRIVENPSFQIKEVNLTVCWKYRGKLNSVSGDTIVRNRQ